MELDAILRNHAFGHHRLAHRLFPYHRLRGNGDEWLTLRIYICNAETLLGRKTLALLAGVDHFDLYVGGTLLGRGKGWGYESVGICLHVKL